MLQKISLFLILLLVPELILASPFTQKQSLDYYQRLALQGDVHAMFKLGFAYETGDGVSANQSSAVKWYLRASQKGHKNARLNLEAMDARGKPFVDTESAYQKELHIKAEQGDLDAQNELARMLINGVLKTANRLQILSWVKHQAEVASAESQFLLAQMYYLGIGVPQNYVDAYSWYSLAAAAGDTIAMSSRDHVASLMSSSQIEQGQQQSREMFNRFVAKPERSPSSHDLDSFSVSSLP